MQNAAGPNAPRFLRLDAGDLNALIASAFLRVISAEGFHAAGSIRID
jgi:hypothetical protein